jgi:hypothetical protein
MRVKSTVVTALLALSLPACSNDPSGAGADAESLDDAELQLAASLGQEADSIGRRNGAPPGRLIHRFIEAVKTSGDSQALALLDLSRALADSGRAAREAGDRETARSHFQASFEALFDAVVIVLPGAYETARAIVDTILARVYERLGDQEAPRIRRVLEIVGGLHAEAGASAAEDEGHALALEVRALMMLQRLREQVQNPGGRGAPGDFGAEPPPYGPGPGGRGHGGGGMDGRR